MYSAAVVEKTLDQFEHENKWRPEPRTPEECDDLVAHINTFLEDDANAVYHNYRWKPGKRPSKLEMEWIQRQVVSEQFLCFASAEYFVTRYGRIRDVQEQIIAFQFRLAQRIFHAILAQYDDQQIAIQLFILKARQVGISTVVALYFLHRILFRTNTHAVMASAQVPQSDKLAMMINTTLSRLPFWLACGRSSTKEKEPRWFNGSALSVQAGSQEVGIAQGSTPTCLHLSEIGDYKTPKKTIEEGLFPACHQTAALFFVMEGTGSTASPWQKEKWEYYKLHWGKGGRFQTLFIPPACASDIYPHADWLRANPMPEGWPSRAMEDTLRMKRRCELFVRSKDYLSSFLGSNWEMDREYMWYWECGYREAIASHSEKTYLSQNAVTDDDAFQSKHDNVFNDETIRVVTEEKTRDYIAYAITGKTILMGADNVPYQPPASEIDYALPRVELHWEANDGNRYDWELIPLKPFDDSDDVNCFDKFLVFEEPRNGEEYAVAIDSADGLNKPNEDRSCCSVSRPRRGKERSVQTGVFTSLRVNSAQMSRISAAIAVYFTTDHEGTITSANPMGARFIIEQIRKTGDECQLQLKIMGFYDHHVMHFYDEKGNIDPTKGHKEGWRTSRWSRPFLLTRFVNAIITGWFKPNDPILIRQLATFIRKEKNGVSEMGHEVGQHDDNIFAPAMGWTTQHDFDNEAAMLEQRYQRKVAAPPIDQRWATNSISID